MGLSFAALLTSVHLTLETPEHSELGCLSNGKSRACLNIPSFRKTSDKEGSTGNHLF